MDLGVEVVALNPAGPVGPTGSTLSEINSSAQALGANAGPKLGYRMKQVIPVDVNGTLIVPASGIIHRIRYNSQTQIPVQLRDAGNNLVIEMKGLYTANEWLDLDLRFDGGLIVTTTSSNTLLEIIYTLHSDL